jgi:hypothetical protein
MRPKGSRDLDTEDGKGPSNQGTAKRMVYWCLGIEDRQRHCSLDALTPRFAGMLISWNINSKSTWSLDHWEPWRLKIKVPGNQGTEPPRKSGSVGNKVSGDRGSLARRDHGKWGPGNQDRSGPRRQLNKRPRSSRYPLVYPGFNRRRGRAPRGGGGG